MAVGVKLFQTSANSLTLRSSLAPAIVCAGWPPLGWFYGEMRLLNIQKRKPQLEAKKPASDGLAGYGIPARWPEHEKSR